MIRHEIIGKKVRIIKSLNPSLQKIEGVIVNETQNIVFIQTIKGEKKVLKDQAVFELSSTNIVNGKDLVGRPHERTGRK